jgi:hypothetical protein
MAKLEEITKLLQGKEGCKAEFKHIDGDNFHKGVFVERDNERFIFACRDLEDPEYIKYIHALVNNSFDVKEKDGNLIVQYQAHFGAMNEFSLSLIKGFFSQEIAKTETQRWNRYDGLLKAQGY